MADAKRSRLRDGLHALAYLALGVGVVATSPAAPPRIAAGVAVAVLGVAGVLLARVDKPRGWGTLLGVIGVAGAWGVLAATGAHAFMDPELAFPAFAVAAGGLVLRRHKRLASGNARAAAFASVLAAYAGLGWGAWRLFHAFAQAPNLLALLATLYGLLGALVLFRFTATATANVDAATFRGWLAANGPFLAVIVIVLGAYAATRDALAARLPFFPLIEFGLGVIVMSGVLTFARARVKRHVADRPVVSPHRAHEPHADTTTDQDVERVRKPVEIFVETGAGVSEYRDAVKAAGRLDDARAERVLEPLTAYQRDVPPPALPLTWNVAAALVAFAAIAHALYAALTTFGVHRAAALPLAVAVLGLGAYRLQDAFRKHGRPWLAVAPAAAGVAVLAFAFALHAHETVGVTGVPVVAWAIAGGVAALFLLIPVLSSWRFASRLKSGARLTQDPRERATLQERVTRERRLVVRFLAATAILALAVPPLLAWVTAHARVGERVLVPQGLATGYAEVLPALVVLFAGAALAAALRALGLVLSKDRVAADADARRARRLALHQDVMTRLNDAA